MIPSFFEGFVSVTEGFLGEAIERQVLQDLGLQGQQIDETQQNVINWCKEKISDEEYKNRIIAAKKILNCYASGETALDLSNLGLTSLPDSFNLPRLERLFLQNNHLERLPDHFNFPNLRGLDLENNHLERLPDHFNLPNLGWLGLQNNRLERLSDHFNLPKLRVLHLQNNHLERLPDHFNLPKLRWFDLQNNHLERLADHFNLPRLERLFLKNNPLESLPDSLNLPNLWILDLGNNPRLAELPLSLANCGSLTELHIEGTAVAQAQVDQILAACRNLRDLEALQALPYLLRLWSGYAEKSAEELQFIHDFSEDDRRNIHEWLVRLSRTRDFRGHQRELAKIVCAMLADLKHGGFKELFMSQVGANHEGCQDRSAMALNELFVSWKILVPQEEMTESDVIALLAGAGKTLALRSALSRMPQMEAQQESVEIYLYYETHLRQRLGLLTAIQTMAYGAMGRRDWINEEELVKEVEAHYMEEAIQLLFFEKLFSENLEAREGLEKRLEEFGERLEALAEQLESEKITEGDYTQLVDQCMFQRAQASCEFKKNWFLSKLPSGSGH